MFQNVFFTAQWATAQNGLSGIIGTLQSIAYAILVVTFLMGVYESFMSGASLSQLGKTTLKFVIAAAIINQWSTFIGDVVNFGTTIATDLMNGNMDVIKTWVTGLASSAAAPAAGATASSTSLFGSLVGLLTAPASAGAAASGALMTAFMLFLAQVVFMAAMLILTTMFIFWGGVLYCIGPLLIALTPSGITSGFARDYARHLAEWAMWPALYAIFCTLMTDIGMATSASALTGNTFINSIFPQGSAANSVAGTTASMVTPILTTVVSLLYGVAMIILPFIAHYVIGGNFAGVAGAIQQAVTAAATGGATLATGGGAMAAFLGQPRADMGGSRGSGGGANHASGGNISGGSAPPATPANDIAAIAGPSSGYGPPPRPDAQHSNSAPPLSAYTQTN